VEPVREDMRFTAAKRCTAGDRIQQNNGATLAPNKKDCCLAVRDKKRLTEHPEKLLAEAGWTGPFIGG
jgi:hypothetical protein